MNKKTFIGTLASGAATAALAFSPLFTMAAINQDNTGTGSNSTNRNTTDITRRQTEERIKRARVTNTMDVTGNTGRNDSSRNTRGGEIKSGKIKATADLTNEVNQSEDSDSLAPLANISGSQENRNTGNRSTNRNTLNVDDRTNLTVTTTARVRNELTVDLNTGHNESTRNTRGGEIESGNIEVSFEVNNTVN